MLAVPSPGAGRRTPQRPSGEGLRPTALLDHRLAVHQHPVDALGLLAGVGVRRGVPDPIRVEQDQVGVVTDPHQPAVDQVQPGGRPPGQVVDAVLQTEHPELADVVTEIARERPPGPRVRLLPHQDRVGTAGVRGVPHDRPDVLLVADVLQDRGRQPIAAAAGPRTPRSAPIRDSAASCAIVRPTAPDSAGSPTPLISIVVQSTGQPWQPFAALDLQRVRDPRPVARVRQPFHDQVRTTDGRPARQQRHQGGRSGQVRDRCRG